MNHKKSPVRVRFAPSPTGHMHIGSARTALYDFLVARESGGQFILRIEDTDRNRLVEGAEQELMDGMHWLGMDWDEGPDKGGDYGPYRQSERKQIYLTHGHHLVEMGKAYYCFCSPERLDEVRKKKQANKETSHYDGTCRRLNPQDARERVKNNEKYVIRFKSPQEGSTQIQDLIRGEICIDNRNLDDFILVKSDGWALYHLAAIVDDHLMKISHVIRGSEWLPTFPIHSLIHRAFGWEEPVWVHLSVFLKPSGKGKMSKRDVAEFLNSDHSIFVKDLQGLGYTPEGVVNWIALMGWSYDDHTEFFKMNDLIEKFSLERLNPTPAAINFTKLDYFNKEHIKTLSPDELAKRTQQFFVRKGIEADIPTLKKIAPIICERITTLDDAVEMAKFFFIGDFGYDPERLSIEGLSNEETIQVAEQILNEIKSLPDLSIEYTQKTFSGLIERISLSTKQVYTFLRESISGQQITPPLFESMEVLGKEEVIIRIKKARDFLKTHN